MIGHVVGWVVLVGKLLQGIFQKIDPPFLEFGIGFLCGFGDGLVDLRGEFFKIVHPNLLINFIPFHIIKVFFALELLLFLLYLTSKLLKIVLKKFVLHLRNVGNLQKIYHTPRCHAVNKQGQNRV